MGDRYFPGRSLAKTLGSITHSGDRAYTTNKRQLLTGLLEAAVAIPVALDVLTGCGPSETSFVRKPDVIVVSGIEVYGLGKESYKTTAELTTLRDYFNEGFSKRVPADKANSSHKEQREAVLDPEKRFLEFFVTRSLWNKFQAEQKNGLSSGEAGVDLPTWLGYHIGAENDQISIIAPSLPKCNLRAVLQRIIVVEDETNENDISSVAPALDIDAKWFMNSDYRGKYNPTTKTWQGGVYDDTTKMYIGGSASIKNTQIDGKTVAIDFALVHEWRHHLFNWVDEYVQKALAVSNPGIPTFSVTNTEATYNVTPWTAYDLHWVDQNHIRGAYTDPRGIGFSHDGNLQYPQNIWGVRPAHNTLTFLDHNGSPIQGEISVYRADQHANKYYDYLNKIYNHIFTTQLSQGELPITDSANQQHETAWFAPILINGETIYPTNWYIEINQVDGKVLKIHLPVAGFNMSALVGTDNASYTIQILNSPPQEVANQTVDMVAGIAIPPAPSTFARMTVAGTEVQFFWSNQ